MRALAVTAVVFYHLNPSWLPGGFLGVDVFFVLSGYLITDHLLAEHRRGGRIDLKGFWVRRARRLLPALALMLLTATAAASVLRPNRLATAGGELLSAVTFTSNWWQIATGASYFTSFGPPPLFQHLWTLGVEEQFHLVWPLVLLVVLRTVRSKGVRVACVLAAAFASMAAMAHLYQPAQDASRLYLGTDTHLFPLLIGAALALLRPAAGLMPSQLLRCVVPLDLAGVLGLAVLGALAITASQDSAALYPGGLGGAAVAAAAVVLAVVQPFGRLATVLSMSPLRWVGQRSYGIYLWHLPALTLATPDGAMPADVPLNAVASVITSVWLAGLSYWLVEEPVRRLGFRVTICRLRRALVGATAPWPGCTVWARIGACAVVTGVLIAGCGLASASKNSEGAAGQVEEGKRALEDGGSAVESSSKVTAIGDSVMLAAAPALMAALPGIDIDAEVGRQLSLVGREVAAFKQRHALADTVVIGLDTNGLGGEKDLQAVVDAIGTGKRIVLVTVHDPKNRQVQNSVNRAVKQVTDKHLNVVVADWDKAIDRHREFLADDGIHPGPGGARIYASTVAKALATLPVNR
ncbi:acyltransferase family protein [Streptomyces sp. NPDC001635]